MDIEIIKGFYDTGIIKFGQFTLKDGSQSSFYLDLRSLVSHPTLLNLVCKGLCYQVIKTKQLQFDLIAGIPLAGIPIATGVSLELAAPAILIRKQVKDYGLKKAIEGQYTSGQKVLLIDDVVTSAASKRETMEILQANDLQCEDILVVVDRRKNKDDGLRIHSLLTIRQIAEVLIEYEYDRLTQADRMHLQQILDDYQ